MGYRFFDRNSVFAPRRGEVRCGRGLSGLHMALPAVFHDVGLRQLISAEKDLRDARMPASVSWELSQERFADLSMKQPPASLPRRSSVRTSRNVVAAQWVSFPPKGYAVSPSAVGRHLDGSRPADDFVMKPCRYRDAGDRSGWDGE